MIKFIPSGDIYINGIMQVVPERWEDEDGNVFYENPFPKPFGLTSNKQKERYQKWMEIHSKTIIC